MMLERDHPLARQALNAPRCAAVTLAAVPPLKRIIIRAGQEAAIRPCVGANYCLDRIYQGGAAYCIHNAATGRELFMPQEIAPAPKQRKVVIVGAGPAGLAAALYGIWATNQPPPPELARQEPARQASASDSALAIDERTFRRAQRLSALASAPVPSAASTPESPAAAITAPA